MFRETICSPPYCDWIPLSEQSAVALKKSQRKLPIEELQQSLCEISLRMSGYSQKTALSL